SSTTTVVVGSGGTLQLQANAAIANGTAAPGFTFARPLFLNGSGAAGNGALESLFGLNTVTSVINLLTSATIGVDAGTLNQITSAMTGPGDLTKVGGGILAIGISNTNWTG